MFFSVSPIKPGFRRRRRAAPLRLFQFLRNFFLLLLLSRSAFFFLLLSSSCAFSRGAALERISVSHFKAAAPQVPDAAVKVRGVRLRLSNQPMFRRTRWAATRLFPFQSEFSIDFGGKGFSNDPLWPPCGPFVAPAMARLWPLVARCGPLVAPCGPFVFYGRTFEKFSRGPLCGPPGHRATRNFSKVRIFGFFFIFRPTVYEEKKRKNYTFSSLSIPSTVGRKMKKTRNPNL